VERVRDPVEEPFEALLGEDVVEHLGEAPVRLDQRLGAIAPVRGEGTAVWVPLAADVRFTISPLIGGLCARLEIPFGLFARGLM
jgi:hypothetical protein